MSKWQQYLDGRVLLRQMGSSFALTSRILYSHKGEKILEMKENTVIQFGCIRETDKMLMIHAVCAHLDLL